MSRVKSNITNAKYGMILYLISILLSFYSRDIFLRQLGDDFNGLVSLLRSIIGLLGIAELGIGTSISYKLYKPLYDNNKKEINLILSFLRKLYLKIALLILGLGIVISFFLPFIVTDNQFSWQLVYFVFFSFLSISLSSYLFNYTQALLGADQKSYIVQTINQMVNLFKVITQIIVLFYSQNVIYWILIEILFAIIQVVVLYVVVKKIYPWLKIDPKISNSVIEDYDEIKTKIKQIFVHRIGAFMVASTDNIFIGIFSGLTTVTLFTNYNLIFQSLIVLFNNLFANLTSSIGNLIVENDKKNMIKVYYELFLFRFFIAIIIIIPLYFSIDSFILLWLHQTNYILPKSTTILLLFNFFVLQTRSTSEGFIHGFGLFHDTWAPKVEFLINLVFTIVLGYFFGLNGVLLGTSISMFLLVVLWKPYFLFTNGFQTTVKHYWIFYFKIAVPVVFLVLLLHLFIDYFTIDKNSILGFIAFNGIIVVFLMLFLSLYYYIFIPQFKNTLQRIQKLIPFKR